MDVHNIKTIDIKSFEKKIKNLSTFKMDTGSTLLIECNSQCLFFVYILFLVSSLICFHWFKNSKEDIFIW